MDINVHIKPCHLIDGYQNFRLRFYLFFRVSLGLVVLEDGIWQRSASSQTVPASYPGNLSDAVIDIFSLVGFVDHQTFEKSLSCLQRVCVIVSPVL